MLVGVLPLLISGAAKGYYEPNIGRWQFSRFVFADVEAVTGQPSIT